MRARNSAPGRGDFRRNVGCRILNNAPTPVLGEEKQANLGDKERSWTCRDQARTESGSQARGACSEEKH